MATTADIYAKAKADEWLNQNQNNLNNTLASSVSGKQTAAQETYNQALNTLNQQAGTYQSTYANDARQAYINSVQSKQTLNDSLQRLGLANTGLGQSQYLGADATYASGLNTLKNTLATNLANIDTEKLNAQSTLNSSLATINSDYYTNKLALDEYINDFYRNVYGDALSQYNTEQSQALQWAQLAFDKQQAAANSVSLDNSTSGSSSSSSSNVDYKSMVNNIISSAGNDADAKELISLLGSDSSLSDADKQYYTKYLNMYLNAKATSSTNKGSVYSNKY